MLFQHYWLDLRQAWLRVLFGTWMTAYVNAQVPHLRQEFIVRTWANKTFKSFKICLNIPNHFYSQIFNPTIPPNAIVNRLQSSNSRCAVKLARMTLGAKFFTRWTAVTWPKFRVVQRTVFSPFDSSHLLSPILKQFPSAEVRALAFQSPPELEIQGNFLSRNCCRWSVPWPSALPWDVIRIQPWQCKPLGNCTSSNCTFPNRIQLRICSERPLVSFRTCSICHDAKLLGCNAVVQIQAYQACNIWIY